jgi:acyl-CoA synthetase (AMP-forming)/AMP-acid ligase II
VIAVETETAVPDHARADLAAALRVRAGMHPDKTAIIESDGKGGWSSVSFAQLDAMADRYAHGFARMGMRPGDRIVLLAPPRTNVLAALYGLVRVRAVPVTIDPGMGFTELLRCIGEIRPDGLIGVPLLHVVRRLFPRPFRTARLFLTNGRRGFGRIRTLASCLTEADGCYEPPPVTEGLQGYVFFTSGSTGTAKPVSITYSNLWHRLRIVAKVCDWNEETRLVACFPSYAPAVLSAGGTAILPPMDFARPGAARSGPIVDAVREHHANALLAAPVVWMNLVRHCEETGARMETVRHGITAGAPIPVNLHRRLGAVLHAEGKLHTPYGATEALPLTAVDSDMLIETWSQTRRGEGICVGPVIPEMRVEVIGISDAPIADWSDELRAPQGAIGELVAGGPTVSAAYIGLPRANALAKIRDGDTVLHRMGDLGRIDARGLLWFCGRKADRIQAGDVLLLPVCGEAVLAEHPQIFQAGIVRVESGAIVACLRLERGASLTAEIVAGLETLVRGSGWEGRIDFYLQCAVIPTDTRHNSKIRRDELARRATKGLRRAIAPVR